MEAVIGRDIGKYMYGGRNLEGYGDEVPGYVHDDMAMAELESYKIGEIKNEDHQLFVDKPDPSKKYLPVYNFSIFTPQIDTRSARKRESLCLKDTS